jgi:hypothetical protein
MGRIINTFFLIVDILWLLAFIGFILVIGFFALEADNASIQNLEVNDIPLGPALVIEETMLTQEKVTTASGDVNMSRNWTERLQDCRENPRCTVKE